MRIALVGSAPSSIHLAPYDDPEWAIWGCSPGAYPHLKRCDAFFELHRWRPGEDGFSPQYIEWMAGLTCPVYLLEERPEIPASVAFPSARLLDQYPGLARSFFTSSLSWMLAYAIDHPGVEEIGLWGVDMAAQDEYGHQKPGCHFFMLEAEKRGIKVTVPPQSDLGRPIPLYGVGEAHPMRVKLDARRKELLTRLASIDQRMQQHDAEYRAAREERLFVQGALDAQQYFEQTWTE